MELQLSQLSNVVDCLREEVKKDLPIQHVAILLAVAEQPGGSMQSLMPKLRMPQGSLSRNIKLLSDQYGLLYTLTIPGTRKQAAVYPTEKCIQLVDRLCRLIQVEADEDVHFCCSNDG